LSYKFINTDYLDSVTGGDPDITRDIVGMFKEQAIEIHSEMLVHYSNKEYKQLGMLAHKAKSSVAIMGMNDLATMLKTFELQAKDSSEPDLYQSYIERFRNETAAAVLELEDLVKQL